MNIVPDISVDLQNIMDYSVSMGGQSVVDMCMKMTPKEFYFWFELWNRKQVRDGIIREFISKGKPVPSYKRLEEMVDKKIEEYRSEG